MVVATVNGLIVFIPIINGLSYDLCLHSFLTILMNDQIKINSLSTLELVR